LDTKYKHVIALYTKDDCFCVVLDNEEDVDSWLKALLSLQHGEEVIDGEPPKPTFGECVSGSLANIPRRRLTLIIQTRRKKTESQRLQRNVQIEFHQWRNRQHGALTDRGCLPCHVVRACSPNDRNTSSCR
jgi:hypothetical protein